MSSLLAVQEAQEKMLAEVMTLQAVSMNFHQSLGCVLAEDITASINVPPFPNSSMDGFTLQSADTLEAKPDKPVTLSVIGDIPAGATPQQTIAAGQAARIMTGAPIPLGADAVVPVEETDFQAHNQPDAPLPESVRVFQAVEQGAYIRPEGMDIRKGQTVLLAGRKLMPQDIGLLATLGILSIQAIPRPRVAVFSTGDELVDPGQPLTQGKIHNSNSYSLAALLEQNGCEVVLLPTAPDQPAEIRSRLNQAVASHCHLILTSAGVSVGTYDYVRQVIEEAGRISFWRVNMRPGKPVAFGSYQGIPLVGLPGNPVSSFVGFLVFVLPILHKLADLPGHQRKIISAELEEALESDGRESYLRAIAHSSGGKVMTHLASHQGSGNLYSLVLANALLIVPSGVKSLPVGSKVELWLLNDDLVV